MSYAGTLDMIGRFQRVLRKVGVGSGTRVALLSANRADAWCTGVAAQALGAAVTSLHPMGSREVQAAQLGDSEVSALVVDPVNFGTRAGELAASFPDVAVFTLGPAEYGNDVLASSVREGTSAPRDLSSTTDMAMLNYTGGTTGKSKGVMRSGGAAGYTALAILAEFELPLLPRYLAIAPISHVSGTNVLPTLLRGGTVHLLEKFDPEQIFATIARERINFTLMVPTMIYTLLDHPRLSVQDRSSLELLLYGASPMSPTRLLEGIEKMGPVFSQLYGQTECYPIAVLRKDDHDPKRPKLFEACGFPTAATEVRLLDDNNCEVEQGMPGEICVRSAGAMTGYWKQPELTDATFSGGWLHTGDVAFADEVGRLFIVDRKKDIIITGGFNVYPREVEDVLSAHPAVATAAVVGIPDPKWGEAVAAYVVLRRGAAATQHELTQLVKERKGSVHAPKQIEFVAALPLTPLGKVDKGALRAKHWAESSRNVG
jgi:fatty-acyl-CoA synthase